MHISGNMDTLQYLHISDSKLQYLCAFIVPKSTQYFSVHKINRDRNFGKIWLRRSFVGYQFTKKSVEVLKKKSYMNKINRDAHRDAINNR